MPLIERNSLMKNWLSLIHAFSTNTICRSRMEPCIACYILRTYSIFSTTNEYIAIYSIVKHKTPFTCPDLEEIDANEFAFHFDSHFFCCIIIATKYASPYSLPNKLRNGRDNNTIFTKMKAPIRNVKSLVSLYSFSINLILFNSIFLDADA